MLEGELAINEHQKPANHDHELINLMIRLFAFTKVIKPSDRRRHNADS